MLPRLKKIRVRRHHIARVLLFVGIAGMGFDLLAVLGVFHAAEQMAHLSAATGATLASLGDAVGFTAEAVEKA